MTTTPETDEVRNHSGPRITSVRLKGWDQYVREARKPDLILPLPDGAGDIRIPQPKGKALRKIIPAMERYDLEAVLYCLLGDDAAPQVLELMEDAPLEALPALCQDIMRHFSIDVESLGALGNEVPSIGKIAPGESQASSS